MLHSFVGGEMEQEEKRWVSYPGIQCVRLANIYYI